MATKWISVENKLPKHFETVLVTAGIVEKQDEMLVYQGAMIKKDKWQLCGVQNADDYTVTAWMPCPKPYEEGA